MLVATKIGAIFLITSAEPELLFGAPLDYIDKLLIKLEQGIESAGKTIVCSDRNVWFKMKGQLYDRMSRSASRLTGQNA